jgi:hypothetical protein
MDGLRPSAVCAGTRLNNRCFIRDKQDAYENDLEYQLLDLYVVLQHLLQQDRD